MPYKDANYIHIRRRKPEEIKEDSWKTVPHKNIVKGKRKYPEGTLARIGKSKKTDRTVIQSIMIPKDKKE